MGREIVGLWHGGNLCFSDPVSREFARFGMPVYICVVMLWLSTPSWPHSACRPTDRSEVLARTRYLTCVCAHVRGGYGPPQQSAAAARTGAAAAAGRRISSSE